MSKPTFPKDLQILFTVGVCVCSMLFLQCFHGGSVSQSCPTLWDPMDLRPPGSSVHGILQARILEWVAIPFSRGSSWPSDGTRVSHIAGRFLTVWATSEVFFLKTHWIKYVWMNDNELITGWLFREYCRWAYHNLSHSFPYYFPLQTTFTECEFSSCTKSWLPSVWHLHYSHHCWTRRKCSST